MAEAHEFAGTVPVREQHRFDQGALERWMAQHVDGYAGPLTIDQFKGGQSNPTYRLRSPGHSYVLRRKPPGELLRGACTASRDVLHAAPRPVPRRMRWASALRAWRIWPGRRRNAWADARRSNGVHEHRF